MKSDDEQTGQNLLSLSLSLYLHLSLFLSLSSYTENKMPGRWGYVARTQRDKIYKYVGGARDPFQCLFNQE